MRELPGKRPPLRLGGPYYIILLFILSIVELFFCKIGIIFEIIKKKNKKKKRETNNLNNK